MLRSRSRAGAPGASSLASTGDGPLVAALLAWYHVHKRPLPWRSKPEPYHVWLAEIMLQQTRMETALPRWHLFLQRFPSIAALAAAPVHAVCDAWAGLGYYSRARNLHRCAQLLVSAYGAQLPRSAAALAALPGIGPYTAGAIASIAFGQPAALVDGNVERVLARLGRMPLPYARPEGRALFWQRAQSLVLQAAQTGPPGDFNQALMELGSSVCSPAAPACGRCPLRPWCSGYAQGDATAFPLKAKAQPRTSLAVSFVLRWHGRRLLLVRRPLAGLWAGLWEPPSALAADGRAIFRARGFLPGRKLGTVEHVLTHRLVRASVYLCEGHRAPRAAPGEERKFVADLANWPMSKLAQKVIALAAAR